MRGWVIGAMVCLLGWTGPVGAQEKPVDVKPAADAARTDESCHGPLYFKLKEKDRENRAQEKARREMQAAVQNLGPVLLQAQQAEVERLLASQQQKWADCVKANRKPAFLCTALAQGREEVCSRLTTEEQRRPCLQLVRTTVARRAGDADRCEAIEAEPVRRMCRFVVTGEFACGDIQDGAIAPICRAVKQVRDGGSLPELAAEMVGPVHWLLALAAGKGAHCDKLPEADEVAACHAAVRADESLCPRVRRLVEHVDEDYTCRNVIAYRAFHPTAQGTEIALVVGSPFGGKAACDVQVRMEVNDEEVTQKIAHVNIAGRNFWQELRHPVGDHPVTAVEADCTWDSTTTAEVPSEAGLNE